MRRIPHAVGLYLAVLELVFALGWTTYAVYLPQLAASVGISAGAVVVILMLDQAIFTVTDFVMGVAADKASRVFGRLGHWVAAITLLSCAAFVCLPFVAGAKLGVVPFLALTVTWAVTSSALRAPPLMLLGKYAARPAIPYLAGLATLGLGIAGAASSYLALTLTKLDPRLPFVIASAAVLLTSLALAKVERTLAKGAPAVPEPPKPVDRAGPGSTAIFALITLIFAVGFQVHVSFNTVPMFKKFTADIGNLMPIFWVGFSLGLIPASLVTKRWGGLPVMGVAGLLGAAAIVGAGIAGSLGEVVAAQFIAGAAWGCILMSAFVLAAALGYTNKEGRANGILFSVLAIATFARMAASATGILGDAALAPLLRWTPAVCWTLGGVLLVRVAFLRLRRNAAPNTAPA